ncbi:MAG: protein kinase [Verrucomicrobiota bacterium]
MNTGLLITDYFPYSPRTLRAELKSRGAFPAEEVIALGLKLTSALAHLHARGLVHRDVKPSNILFIAGEPKLADAGLVAAMDDARSLVGTAGYIAPEGPGTPQADLYALGRVLYEAAFGKDRQEFPSLPANLASRPDHAQLVELNAVLLKCCAANRRDRHRTAEELRVDLKMLQQGRSVRRKLAITGAIRMMKLPGLAAAIIAIFVAGAILVRDRDRTIPLSSEPEALKLYAHARYLRQSSTLEQTLQANSNLLMAVKLDPKFVDAYYLLTETYYGNWGNRLPPYQNTRSNLQWVANHLYQLRPNSAQYHTVNGWIHYLNWQFPEALKELELAVTLDPAFLRAHGIFAGLVLRLRGDAAAALREFEAAEKIDLADVTIQTHLGTPYYFLRDYPKAIAQFTKARRLEPRAHLPLELLGDTYEANEQYEESLDCYEAAENLQGGDPKEITERYKRWRSVLAEKGPRGLWEAKLEFQDQNWRNPYAMARLQARLEREDEVFTLLNRAWDERHPAMGWLLVDHHWDKLRNDSRFKALLDKVGFGRVPRLESR